MKIIHVHSAKMAGWLMLNGIMFKYTAPDTKNQGRLVFAFPKIESVENTMKSYPQKSTTNS